MRLFMVWALLGGVNTKDVWETKWELGDGSVHASFHCACFHWIMEYMFGVRERERERERERGVYIKGTLISMFLSLR